MRFVKFNRLGEKIKFFLQSVTKKDDRCDKTDSTADNGQHNISLNKIISRFSFGKIVEFIKKEYHLFRRDVDIKKASIAVTVTASLIALLIFNVNFTFAYTAFVDGVEVGSVPNKAYVQNCVDSVNSEFSQYVSGRDVVSGNIVCVPSVIRRGDYTDVDDLTENIKSTSPIMTRAYAIEVDGIVHTALPEKALAKEVLDRVASSYKNDETTEVNFEEDVDIVHELVPMAVLTDAEGALTRLMGYTTLRHTITVDATISAEEFAANNYMDMDYFKYLNPGVGDEIEPDEEVFVPQRKPVITVMTYDTVIYDMTVPFEEQVTNDDKMYEGTERLVQSGRDGVTTITEKIVRSNGEVVNQTVINTEVVSEPIMQLRAVGTMPRPAGVGTGSFIRPYYGSVSSRFGSRSSDYHSGVDLNGRTGDPVKAADSGKVVFAGWSGGYGNVIKIDHGNGYLTYYAHCESLRAREGDIVDKGQIIATVGSTGRSTGPHLHFEIRYNDEPLNPMNYIN